MANLQQFDVASVYRRICLRPNFLIFAISTITFAFTPVTSIAQQSVEQWKRFEVTILNSSWSGNPFDIVLTANFTHSASGTTKTQFGFYDGSDTWKIYFMPDRTGAWSYTTNSSDSDLDGAGGSFTATTPTISGPIRPGDVHWEFNEGTAIAPTILAVGPYVRANDISVTQGMVDWAANVAGATYLGTTLLNFEGDSPYTESQEDRMYVDGSGGEGIEFYLPAWNRSNAFYDAVRDENMGHYILIFSDDASAPQAHGIPEGSNGTISSAELRLFRYLVARFAPYPKVIWDSGIDIGENRSDQWINNFVAWFHSNDPWQHPIASRTGGGSGGIHPSAADYYSDGERALPSRADLISRVQNRTVPTFLTDRYRENYPSPFDGGRDKIRQAAWQAALTYGTGVYFGGSDAGGYLVSNYASDLEAAPDLGHLRDFLASNVVDFSSLSPLDAVVESGDAWVASDQNNEYVVYSLSGSLFTLSPDLSGGNFQVTWFDPTSGQSQSDDNISGDGPFEFVKPGNNASGRSDWALHIVRDQMAKVPKAPTDLQAQ